MIKNFKRKNLKLQIFTWTLRNRSSSHPCWGLWISARTPCKVAQEEHSKGLLSVRAYPLYPSSVGRALKPAQLGGQLVTFDRRRAHWERRVSPASAGRIPKRPARIMHNYTPSNINQAVNLWTPTFSEILAAFSCKFMMASEIFTSSGTTTVSMLKGLFSRSASESRAPGREEWNVKRGDYD